MKTSEDKTRGNVRFSFFNIVCLIYSNKTCIFALVIMNIVY